MNTQSVLVTGGAGFVGKNLVARLLAQGHDVTVLDHNPGEFGLGPDSEKGTLRVVSGDIRSYASVRKATRGVTGVVHLAAVSGVPFSMKAPEITTAINVVGTLNVLRAASESGVRRLVFYSSAAVYGKKSHAVSEDEPKNPISVYGTSKLASEEFCLTYNRLGKLGCVVLRPFNIYGRGDNKGVLAHFLERARSNKPLVIYGSGRQTRDFVNIDDVVTATTMALWKPRIEGMIFNVGSGKTITISKLAEMVGASFGRNDYPIERRPQPPGDLAYSCANVSRSRRALGFKAAIRLDKWLKANARTTNENPSR